MSAADDPGREPGAGTDPRLEILEYLHAHPSAADTVDGIIQWWLPLQRFDTAKEVIQRALDDLVERGIIDYVDAGGDKRIFRLAERRNGDGTDQDEEIT